MDLPGVHGYFCCMIILCENVKDVAAIVLKEFITAAA